MLTALVPQEQSTDISSLRTLVAGNHIFNFHEVIVKSRRNKFRDIQLYNFRFFTESTGSLHMKLAETVQYRVQTT